MNGNQKLKQRVKFTALLPPSIVFLACIVIGVVAHGFVPVGFPPENTLRYIFFGFLFSSGLVLFVFSLRAFRRSGEKISQRSSTVVIVTDGPYGTTRNPMYLAYVLMTLGIAMLLGSAWIFLLMVPGMWAVHLGVVRREERYLSSKFGEVYRRYKLRVQRWL